MKKKNYGQHLINLITIALVGYINLVLLTITKNNIKKYKVIRVKENLYVSILNYNCNLMSYF